MGPGYDGTELRVVGEDGSLLPPGEVGEIFMRKVDDNGPTFMYVGSNPPPATDDGFTSIGDLGWLDDDGFLYIADRRVDMIITGGANVFPAEVESALADHPDVADVVVIGLADPEWGRRVHAVIQPADPDHPPLDVELIAYAKERLAPYKVPKSVELVDRIPRSEATKVSRQALVAERGG